MSKTIVMTLDPQSIRRAANQFLRYRDQLIKRSNSLIERLTERGERIAKVQIRTLNVVYTSQLHDSITGFFDEQSRCGIIRAGAWYAIFVEYGTGVTGSRSPHPDPKGWAYDVHGHGEKGWVYYNERDGKWHRTKGMASRPFMYRTAKELEAICQSVAKGVFKT